MAPKGRGKPKKVADKTEQNNHGETMLNGETEKNITAEEDIVDEIKTKKVGRSKKVIDYKEQNDDENMLKNENGKNITDEEKQPATASVSGDKIVSKRQQKPAKTDKEESAKVEEKEGNSKAKRGRKAVKKENGDLGAVNLTEVTESHETETDSEVKELPTRSRRKEKANVEESDLKEEESKPQPKETKAKAGKKAAQAQLKEAANKGAARKRKIAVDETESATAELVQEKDTLVVEGGRQLRVALKRNRSLDEMAKNQRAKDTELTAKGPSKSKGKRAAKDSAEDSQPTKKSKEEASKSKSSSKKEKIPDVTALDFTNVSKSASGKPWNLKISSWNVNGVRAWLEKNGLSYLHHEKPDILCIQETKCSQDKLPSDVNVDGYECYWLSGDKDGYSGVGLLSKKKPISVEYGIGIEDHDNEGRVITAEYDEFYLVAAYVPNAGRGLVRLGYRQEWDKDFRAYLKKLDEMKPVVLCGDLNVAHEEIDLANPKNNKKNAGFTKEEREGFSTLLSEGFVDTFRHLYPKETGAYTFWTYMMNARAKNVGWRLDYFVISKKLLDNLCDVVIRKDVYGSDHCPSTLFLHV